MMTIEIVACVLFFAFGLWFYTVQAYTVCTVCLIAFTSYLAVAMDILTKTSENGIRESIPRYADWLLTTVLLLWTVVVECRGPKSTNLIVLLLFLDVLMIATGFLAAEEYRVKRQYIFYGVSMFFFFFLFFVLLRLRPPMGLFSFLFFSWLVYPILWILHHRKILSNDRYRTAITIVDVISKIGYGVFLTVSVGYFRNKTAPQS